MSDGLLSSLSSAARRSLIRQVLPAYIEKGYSGNAALKEFRDSGFGIGRSAFFEIFRDVLGIEQRSNRIRNVNKSSIPTDDVFDTLKKPHDEKYRIIYKAQYHNEQTGDIENLYFGVDTSHINSIEAMEQEAADSYNELYGTQGNTFLGITIHKGFINPEYR